MRMLAAALRRNVRDRALKHLEQRLLNALARNVAGDGGIFALAGNLVDLIDIDDAVLGQLDVEIRRLNQTEQDVLDVLADVARLGERRRVRDGERDLKRLGERLREQRLARRRTDRASECWTSAAPRRRPAVVECACSGCKPQRTAQSWRGPDRSTYWSSTLLSSCGVGRCSWTAPRPSSHRAPRARSPVHPPECWCKRRCTRRRYTRPVPQSACGRWFWGLPQKEHLSGFSSL